MVISNGHPMTSQKASMSVRKLTHYSIDTNILPVVFAFNINQMDGKLGGGNCCGIDISGNGTNCICARANI